MSWIQSFRHQKGEMRHFIPCKTCHSDSECISEHKIYSVFQLVTSLTRGVRRVLTALSYSVNFHFIHDDDDDDDVARSGRCAYMLGLSVNSVISVEGTLFFIFSFRPSSFSTIFFYIYFLSSSSSSSFPIISLLSSYKLFCSLLLFLDFTLNLLYSSSSFLFIFF